MPGIVRLTDYNQPSSYEEIVYYIGNATSLEHDVRMDFSHAVLLCIGSFLSFLFGRVLFCFLIIKGFEFCQSFFCIN